MFFKLGIVEGIERKKIKACNRNFSVHIFAQQGGGQEKGEHCFGLTSNDVINIKILISHWPDNIVLNSVI